MRVAWSEERSRTLLEINNGIISSFTEEALLRSIAKALRRVVDFGASALTLYLPQRDTFRLLAVEGNVGSFKVGQEIQHEDTGSGGYSITDSPACAAISKKSSSIRTNDSLPLRVCAPIAWSPLWLAAPVLEH